MTQQSPPPPATAISSEYTPLLAHTDNSISELPGELAASNSTTTLYNEFVEQDSVSLGTMAKQEAKTMVVSSIPVALSSLMQFSIGFANIVSLGHLGSNELSAASLGNMTVVMLINGPSVGLAAALDTFCSTAFTASKDRTLVGFHLQRGIISVLAHYLMVLPLLFNMERLLLAMNQEPEIARLCGQYVRIQMLASLPWILFECIKRFLQAQRHMRASTTILMTVLPIHMINNYLFVWSPTFGFGFLGAAAANVVTCWLMFFGILVYTCRCDARQAWGGWSWKPFMAMGQYYRLAIPSVVMICSDWLCWEGMTIAASYLGNVPLAAQSIVLNTCTLTYQIPGGLGTALSNRVGNLLGQARARRSMVASNVGLSLGAFAGALNSLFFLATASWWGKIYSTDPEVIACVALIMPVSALFQISDAVSAVTGGALRSLGRQRHGACINFPCFYLIGFPLSIFFAYGPWKLGIIGLWAGLSIGVTMAAIGQTYICVSADFQHEVDRCMRQVSSYKDVAKDDSTGAQGMASEDRNASTATLASEV